MFYVSAVSDVACTRLADSFGRPRTVDAGECVVVEARPQDLFCTREPQRSKVRLRNYFGDDAVQINRFLRV